MLAKPDQVDQKTAEVERRSGSDESYFLPTCEDGVEGEERDGEDESELEEAGLHGGAAGNCDT